MQIRQSPKLPEGFHYSLDFPHWAHEDPRFAAFLSEEMVLKKSAADRRAELRVLPRLRKAIE
jgi:hypothetical protein